MLLPNLILLIDVTFSTPTGFFANNAGMPSLGLYATNACASPAMRKT